MDIKQLCELRQHLIDYVEYLPPDNASDAIWERAVERAEDAQDRLDDLGPALALLDAIDTLTNRVETITTILVKAYGNFSTECGGDFFPDDCREACADFFTCRRDAELADMVQLLGGNKP